MKPSRKPITGAIIGQEFESGARTVSEDEDDPREGIGIELRFAQSAERIDALAEVDRLDGEQDFELRSELDHQSQERKKLAQRAESEAASSAG